jgi:hypothetical protein
MLVPSPYKQDVGGSSPSLPTSLINQQHTRQKMDRKRSGQARCVVNIDRTPSRVMFSTLYLLHESYLCTSIAFVVVRGGIET